MKIFEKSYLSLYIWTAGCRALVPLVTLPYGTQCLFSFIFRQGHIPSQNMQNDNNVMDNHLIIWLIFLTIYTNFKYLLTICIMSLVFIK